MAIICPLCLEPEPCGNGAHGLVELPVANFEVKPVKVDFEVRPVVVEYSKSAVSLTEADWYALGQS